MPDPQEPDPVDWSVLHELAVQMEDDEIVDEVVATYLAELPRRRAALTRAVDDQELRDAAHALKASSLTVGALTLGQLCRDVEEGVASGRLAEAADVAVAAALEAARVEAALRSGPPATGPQAGSNR